MKNIEYPQLLFDEQYREDNAYLRIRIVCYWLIGITTFLLILYSIMKEVC